MLQIIAENTAKFAGGKTITKRFIDLIEPKPQDTRSGDEIAIDFIKRAGLKIKGSEEVDPENEP